MNNLSNNCAKLIQYGLLVLGCNETKIRSLFYDKEQLKVKYDESGCFMLEIILEGGTLTCILDELRCCTKSYLFLDCVESIELYMQHCNGTYQNATGKLWINGGCFIELKQNVTDVFFMFYPFTRLYNHYELRN